MVFDRIISWGQCDIEIIGFNPISTDITLAVNGGNCGTKLTLLGSSCSVYLSLHLLKIFKTTSPASTTTDGLC